MFPAARNGGSVGETWRSLCQCVGEKNVVLNEIIEEKLKIAKCVTNSKCRIA
jgi:hypothetical protein